MKTRVTDYIADYLYKIDIKEVFMVSGGGMMFLSDGLAQHPHLRVVCNHHEQASAMAAVSYAKYNENFGACYLTTGCGCTNAITGLLNAWQDNVSCIFISGQSKRKETVANSGLKLRQFGVQEANIIPVVDSLTKYAVMVNEPEMIAYHLDKATFLAKSGRPGPVWIDVPLDVQGAIIETKGLRRLTKLEKDELINFKEEPTKEEIGMVIKLLAKAKRPVIIAGQGIRLSKGVNEFRKFVERLKIPVVASRLGINVLPSAHPLFIGRIGNKGDRAGNFAVQNSDLVIAIGSRLSVSSTGHEYKTFAREAKIVVVDIDPEEHRKNTVRIDHFINADAKNFITQFNNISLDGHSEWIKKCQHWKSKYPVCLLEYANEKNGINLYYFVDRLSANMKPDSVTVSDAGSSFYVASQGIQLKARQRYITTGGQAEMGYTIPATIGVSFARGKKEVLGITGDGSFQMNLQELQTIIHHDLPIKLFVWNNDGYLSIRASQRKFFNGRFIGTDSTSGVSFPDLRKIARAYGIQYFKASDSKKLDGVLKVVMRHPKAVICEIMCLRDQEIVPTVSSLRKEDGTMVSKPLEDMYPFLDRVEFKREMIIRPLED
ncbi:MAG: thiamine pyrophosphate-binding protein [Euryarchaeota archaeon]|nr:thiamine pyrophosphate-binding protein [Euryarchaeota archaeon]MBU4038106.1 thiamine pyrophosphate-binding protein [Pseudomonadota bacterium]